MLDLAIFSAIAMHISSAGADTFDDLSPAVVFPPYRLDRMPVYWVLGPRAGRRPQRYLPRDSCHSRNIPDATTIAEPASSATDGRSPHTRYPIMIAHTSEK
jgi:hypothetical protein